MLRSVLALALVLPSCADRAAPPPAARLAAAQPAATPSTSDATRADTTVLAGQIPTDRLTPEPIRLTVGGLPAPYASESASRSPRVVAPPADARLRVPAGFAVQLFAEGLDAPRWLAEGPGGSVLVAESRAHRIRRLDDRDGDGVAERTAPFAERGDGLNQPLGMALVGQALFVGNTDAVVRLDLDGGAVAEPAVRVVALPGGGYNQHWTRNVVANRTADSLFVTVGSQSNADPEPLPRASVFRIALDGSGRETVAFGLRNPVGLALEPVTGQPVTVVNERDGLGDDLVPDYVTSVEPGGFYGWPYFYFGDNEDPRKAGERPDLAKRTLVPDLAVGAHTASLGLAFYTGDAFPKRYRGGMFIGQHGSWNRSRPSGYRVAFVPFDANGHVAGPPQTFLSNFLADKDPLTTNGRPVGVLALRDGSLLVADDAGNRIWRVSRDGPDEGEPAIAGLMLVDAEKDKPIYPLGDGAELDRKKLKTGRLNVIASESGPVGSVRFDLDGAIVRTENASPFAFAGTEATAKDGVNYLAWTPSKGEHELVATPFRGPDGTGDRGRPLKVRFRVK